MSFPPIPYELAPYALLTLVTGFLAGLARGFSGFGAAMVFVPLVSAVLGPVVATPVLLIADAATSSPMIVRAFRACSWPDVRRIGVGAAVGFPIGAHVLTATDPIIVRWAVTILIFLSLAVLVSGWRYTGPKSRPVAAGVGCISGLMSGLAQIGGPPVVVYWLSHEMDTARVRANLIAYFFFLMSFGLLIFAYKGLLPAKVFWLAAAAAPGYALGVAIGSRMFPLASTATFRKIAIALVALAAIAGNPALDPLLRGAGR